MIANFDIVLRDVTVVLKQNDNSRSHSPFRGAALAHLDRIELSSNSRAGEAFELNHISLDMQLFGLRVEVGPEDYKRNDWSIKKKGCEGLLDPQIVISRDRGMESESDGDSPTASIRLILKHVKKFLIEFRLKSMTVMMGKPGRTERIVGLSERLREQADLVRLYVSNIDQGYCMRMEKEDPIHGKILSSYLASHVMLTSQQKEVPLQILVLHLEILEAIYYLVENLASAQPEDKSPEVLLQRNSGMSSSELKRVDSAELAAAEKQNSRHILCEVVARQSSKPSSHAHESNFSFHNLTLAVQAKREHLKNPQKEPPSEVLSCYKTRLDLPHVLPRGSSVPGQESVQVMLDLEDIFLLDVIELCNPLPGEKVQTPFVSIECAEEITGGFYDIVEKTALPQSQEGVFRFEVPKINPVKSQYVRLTLYGKPGNEVGLYYVKIEGKPFGTGKTIGINCELASPVVILPSLKRVEGIIDYSYYRDGDKPFDCIVVSPGTIKLDNYGTFADKMQLYGTHLSGGEKHRRASGFKKTTKHKHSFTISVTASTDASLSSMDNYGALMSLTTGKWQKQDGVEFFVVKTVQNAASQVIYMKSPDGDSAPVQHFLRFIQRKSSIKLETVMLPRGSGIVLRFDQNSLNKVLDVIAKETEQLAGHHQTMASNVANLMQTIQTQMLKDVASLKEENLNLVKLRASVWHKVEIILKLVPSPSNNATRAPEGFTASVEIAEPLELALTKDEVTIEFDQIKGQMPHRCSPPDMSLELDQLYTVFIKALADLSDMRQEQQIAEARANLWKEIGVRVEQVPTEARQIARMLRKQIKMIRERKQRSTEEIKVYGQSCELLHKHLEFAEQHSCVIRLKAAPLGTKACDGTTGKCRLVYIIQRSNYPGLSQGDAEVRLPSLRINCVMDGDTNFDFDAPKILYYHNGSQAVLFKTSQLSIISAVHPDSVARWFSMMLDPEVPLMEYKINPASDESDVLVKLGDDKNSNVLRTTLNLLKLDLFKRNAVEGRGHSVVDIAWTTTSIAYVQDAIAAFTCAVSTGGIDDDADGLVKLLRKLFRRSQAQRTEPNWFQGEVQPTQDEPAESRPFHYEISGLNRTKLNINNLQPSFGLFNRSGVTVGISNYRSLDGSCHNACKLFLFAIFFLVGLDLFPAIFAGAVFLYASLDCDQKDLNCPSRVTALTTGLMVVVVCVFLAPAGLHALSGFTNRTYGLVAGYLCILVFAFKSEEGFNWILDLLKKPDGELVLEWLTIWICLFCTVLSFWNLERTITWSRLSIRPPKMHNLQTLQIIGYAIGILGLMMAITLGVEYAIWSADSNDSLPICDSGEPAEALCKPSEKGYDPTLYAAFVMLAVALLVALRIMISQVGMAFTVAKTQLHNKPLHERAFQSEIEEIAETSHLETQKTFLAQAGLLQSQQSAGISIFGLVQVCAFVILIMWFWIWNGIELGWAVERATLKTANVTRDTSRNFMVFGFLAVGWFGTFLVGELLLAVLRLAVQVALVFIFVSQARLRRRQNYLENLAEQVWCVLHPPLSTGDRRF